MAAKDLKCLFGWLLLVIAILVTIGTKISYPELSETQFLLAFWDRWLAVLALIGAGYWYIDE